jgi:hypothetical protein
MFIVSHNHESLLVTLDVVSVVRYEAASAATPDGALKAT